MSKQELNNIFFFLETFGGQTYQIEQDFPDEGQLAGRNAQQKMNKIAQYCAKANGLEVGSNSDWGETGLFSSQLQTDLLLKGSQILPAVAIKINAILSNDNKIFFEVALEILNKKLKDQIIKQSSGVMRNYFEENFSNLAENFYFKLPDSSLTRDLSLSELVFKENQLVELVSIIEKESLLKSDNPVDILKDTVASLLPFHDYLTNALCEIENKGTSKVKTIGSLSKTEFTELLKQDKAFLARIFSSIKINNDKDKLFWNSLLTLLAISQSQIDQDQDLSKTFEQLNLATDKETLKNPYLKGILFSSYGRYLQTVANTVKLWPNNNIPEESDQFTTIDYVRELTSEALTLDNIISFLQRQCPFGSTHYHYLTEVRNQLRIPVTAFELQDMFTGTGQKNTTLYSKNTILYGPPGTGKTYHTVNHAVAIIENQPLELIQAEAYTKVLARYQKLVAEKRILFTTFHQAYGYEEFVEGIKPVLNQENANQKELEYELASGIFKTFCDEARQKKLPMVFIIDEINRGNLAKIFGEMITLIEESKREGQPEEKQVILPYSQETFSIPDNIYIVGTMNTSDKSIALIDTALRRRFTFFEMMPDYQALAGISVEGIMISELLEVMNKRIEVLYDRDHLIGQAYFMSLKSNPSLDRLAKIFEFSILPLLQEYFYDDYEKIQYILGDNAKSPDCQFIRNEQVMLDSLFKGTVDIFDEVSYKTQKTALSKIEAYRGIL
ncbi:McrB family protein [Vagococcus intermedius]|uniref:AAA family ATPase n=1 Tax=Vagococcus intermedius TaxID=2991418 RepID=A0AAF0CWN1_9ENTE|nr:AAA family ATPase [Vagococcus intermedius]WEG74243.1 AAA family ATPase [Vagococcus intermedius]WEG76325.1 AAA family ATPase [Vagococcus intermedius]